MNLLFFLIWIALILYSVHTGVSNCFACSVRLVVNSFKIVDYTLGLSHKQYKGTTGHNGQRVIIHTLTLGLFFAAIEIDFYKPAER